MVILSLDYGEKRIGAAIGNTVTKTSSPVSPFLNRDKISNLNSIMELVRDYDVSRIVIGYPLNMDGTESLMSGKVKKFKNYISAHTGLEVLLVDERLTSFEAGEMLKDSRGDIRKSKGLIDSVSAHIILTDYLETI